MLVTIKNTDYHVYWKYYRESAGTGCFICRMDDKRPVVDAVAKCNKTDQFRKDVGRKISLERAANQFARETFQSEDMSEAAYENYRYSVVEAFFKAYFNR